MRHSLQSKIIAAAMALLMTAGGAVSAFAAPTFSVTDPFSVPNSLITAGGRANTGYINARNQSAQQEAQQQQQAAQEAARQQAAQVNTQPVQADPDPDPEPTEEEQTTPAPTTTTSQDDTTPEKGVLKVTPVNDNVYYDEDRLYCEVYIINGFDRPVEVTGKQQITLYAGDTKVASGSGNISTPLVIQPGEYATHMFVFTSGQFTPGITLKDLDTVARLSYAWADE